jgi:hypothetical protein
METVGVYIYGGDDGFIYEDDLFWSPTFTVVQVGFSEILGDGLHKVGISTYWWRPDLQGADVEVPIGDWPYCYHTLYHDKMSGVRIAAAVSADSELMAYFNVFWWGN